MSITSFTLEPGGATSGLTVGLTGVVSRLATSESYKTKAPATNGIKSVTTNAPNAVVDDQT